MENLNHKMNKVFQSLFSDILETGKAKGNINIKIYLEVEFDKDEI